MSSEIIPCPACRHSVRVPESLLGQAVRCPSCKSYFTAPTRDAEGRLGEGELLAEAPPSQTRGRQPSGRKPSVRIAGWFLLFVGLLGMVANGNSAANITNNTEVMLDAFKKMVDDPKSRPFFDMFTKPNGQKYSGADVTRERLMQLRTVFLVFVGISLIACFGAGAILLNRCYWLAVLGSGAAIVNLSMCCCGSPIVGIYCLIKLLDPEVRSLFNRS